MKNMVLHISVVLMIFITACQKPEIVKHQENTVDPVDTVVAMQWVTRMDNEKEIVNIANGVIFKNWFIRSGDRDDPVKIMAFDLEHGAKEWELTIEELEGYEITYMHLIGDILLARNSYYVFAIDLESRMLLWDVNLREKSMRLGRTTKARNGKFYINADFSFGNLGQTLNVYEFDPYTGEHRIVYTKYRRWGTVSSRSRSR